MLRMIFNLSRQYMILCQWLDLELDQGKVQRQKKYIYTKGFTCVFIQLFWNKAHYGNKLHLLLDAEIGIILWEFKQLVRASIDIRWSLKLQLYSSKPQSQK